MTIEGKIIDYGDSHEDVFNTANNARGVVDTNFRRGVRLRVVSSDELGWHVVQLMNHDGDSIGGTLESVKLDSAGECLQTTTMHKGGVVSENLIKGESVVIKAGGYEVQAKRIE